MENQENKSTQDIILTHVAFGMTAGAIPVPLLDIAAVSAVQLNMIRQIAAHYNADFNSNLGKSLISAVLGSSIARAGASIVKAFPGIGTALGIGTQVVLSGASTYAVGKLFDSHFAGHGTLDSFNVEEMKQKFKELYEQGKKAAQDMYNESKDEDVYVKIEKLNKLRESGAITESEFEEAKKNLLSKIS